MLIFSPQRRTRLLASLVLTFCCAGWAFSFPGVKALMVLGERNVSGSSTFFLATLCVGIRFAISALLLAPFVFGKGRSIQPLELKQGIGIGSFGGLGLVFQMDGAAYTNASTAAFLTQGYCLWIPLFVAIRSRRWPPRMVWICCGFVLVGTAILAGARWNEFTLGRGEAENLLGSMLFAGQILWLERPIFSRNHVLRFTWVMFATMSVICLPLAAVTAPSLGGLVMAYASPGSGSILGMLVAVCTIANFLLMNQWQPSVSASEAGLIYCTEPVFTCIVALFLPEVLSKTLGIHYANEALTSNLLVGGGLILGANILLQLRPVPTPGSTK